MKPAGLVAKHETSIDQRRRSPDRPARFVTPHELAFVSSQTVEIAIVRSDIHAAVRHDWACPDSVTLFADAAERLVLPNQFAVVLPKAIDVAVLGGGVDKAVRNRGCGIGVGADARLPHGRTVRQVETEQVAMFGADVRAAADDGQTSLHRAEPFSLVNECAVFEIQRVEETVFTAEVDSTVDHGG